MTKDNDVSFASLQDNNEKLCGFFDWLLDTIEVHNCQYLSVNTVLISTKVEKKFQGHLEHCFDRYSHSSGSNLCQQVGFES